MQIALFDLALPRPDAAQLPWFQEMLDALRVTLEPAWPDRFGASMRQWLIERGHQPIRTLSLFSGGGGLDIAFHDAGFDIVQMVEVEAKYAETLKANARRGMVLASTDVLCMDVREYVPDADLSVDFIIGGPPCQTFSAAGRRAAGVAGTTDPRGNLFQEYVRILGLLQPRGFLFENVYGITGAQNGRAWKDIRAAFKDAGYTIYHRVLDAADYGAPQHRERLFIVGVRDGQYQFPQPTHGPDSPDSQPFYTAGEAVRGADIAGVSQGVRGRYGELLTNIPPGLNYSFYTKEMGHPAPVFGWRSKFSDFLYKADPMAPVRTIKAQGGQYTGPFSWENRPFSIAELKRLQTIPDSYEIVGGRQVSIEQIGNSVPPQIGRILALSILHQVMGVSLPGAMPYLDERRALGFRRRKRLLTEVYGAKAKQAISQLYTASEAMPSRDAPPIAGQRRRFLSPADFLWAEVESPGAIGLRVSYQDDHSTWMLTAGLDNRADSESCYEITIVPAHGRSWPQGLSRVRLSATALDSMVFTGLWKAFEESLYDRHGIADLVQFSGYYQYEPHIKATMRFAARTGVNSWWQIVRNVVEGVGVATQLTADHLAMLWEVDAGAVLPHLKALRALGYEVRSHNTNPQIPMDAYLIPYSFPTLTPRSVQLRKKLENDAS